MYSVENAKHQTKSLPNVHSVMSLLNRDVEELSVILSDLDLEQLTTKNTQSTLLHLAVKDQNIEVILLLFSMMSDINIVDYKDKIPFIWAVERKMKNIVDIFLNHRDDVDTVRRDENLMNALHHAILLKNRKMATQILKYTMKQSEDRVVSLFTDRNVKGYSAIHMMIIYDTADILSYCVQNYENYINFSIQDNYGRTAMHLTCKKAMYDYATTLVPRTELSNQDAKGNTVLHYCAKRGHIEILNCILAEGIDINIRNQKDQTALHLSTLYSHDGISNILTKEGADVSIRYDEQLYLLRRTMIDNKLMDMDMEFSEESALEMNIEDRKSTEIISLPFNTLEEDILIDEFGYITPANTTLKKKKTKREMNRLSTKKRARRNSTQSQKQKMLYWDKLIKNYPHYNNSRRSQVKKKIYGGIPDHKRRAVWLEIFDIHELKSTNPGVYDAYVNGDVDSSTLAQIDMDINRACRRNVQYAERFGKGQITLFNVLRAYSAWDPVVSYCQGMSDMTAMLLLYFEDSEEECFWILTQLLKHEKYYMQGYFKEDFSGLKKSWYVHECCLRDYLPKLHEHFENMGILPQFYVNPWFLKIYLDSLSDGLVRRIWDVLIYEGNFIFYTVNMVILRTQLKKLLKMDTEGLMLYWKEMGNNILDNDAFMNLVSKNQIPYDQIQIYEQEYEQNPNLH